MLLIIAMFIYIRTVLLELVAIGGVTSLIHCNNILLIYWLYCNVITI